MEKQMYYFFSERCEIVDVMLLLKWTRSLIGDNQVAVMEKLSILGHY